MNSTRTEVATEAREVARRIPSYAALRAFEAAARLGNLRRASEELSLTVSAISHQVKSLEADLGISLFERPLAVSS